LQRAYGKSLKNHDFILWPAGTGRC
jgi:hypothetical protein